MSSTPPIKNAPSPEAALPVPDPEAVNPTALTSGADTTPSASSPRSQTSWCALLGCTLLGSSLFLIGLLLWLSQKSIWWQWSHIVLWSMLLLWLSRYQPVADTKFRSTPALVEVLLIPFIAAPSIYTLAKIETISSSMYYHLLGWWTIVSIVFVKSSRKSYMSSAVAWSLSVQFWILQLAMALPLNNDTAEPGEKHNLDIIITMPMLMVLFARGLKGQLCCWSPSTGEGHTTELADNLIQIHAPFSVAAGFIVADYFFHVKSSSTFYIAVANAALVLINIELYIHNREDGPNRSELDDDDDDNHNLKSKLKTIARMVGFLYYGPYIVSASWIGHTSLTMITGTFATVAGSAIVACCYMSEHYWFAFVTLLATIARAIAASIDAAQQIECIQTLFDFFFLQALVIIVLLTVLLPVCGMVSLPFSRSSRSAQMRVVWTTLAISWAQIELTDSMDPLQNYRQYNGAMVVIVWSKNLMLLLNAITLASVPLISSDKKPLTAAVTAFIPYVLGLMDLRIVRKEGVVLAFSLLLIGYLLIYESPIAAQTLWAAGTFRSTVVVLNFLSCSDDDVLDLNVATIFLLVLSLIGLGLQMQADKRAREKRKDQLPQKGVTKKAVMVARARKNSSGVFPRAGVYTIELTNSDKRHNHQQDEKQSRQGHILSGALEVIASLVLVSLVILADVAWSYPRSADFRREIWLVVIKGAMVVTSSSAYSLYLRVLPAQLPKTRYMLHIMFAASPSLLFCVSTIGCSLGKISYFAHGTLSTVVLGLFALVLRRYGVASKLLALSAFVRAVTLIILGMAGWRTSLVIDSIICLTLAISIAFAVVTSKSPANQQAQTWTAYSALPIAIVWICGEIQWNLEPVGTSIDTSGWILLTIKGVLILIFCSTTKHCFKISDPSMISSGTASILFLCLGNRSSPQVISFVYGVLGIAFLTSISQLTSKHLSDDLGDLVGWAAIIRSGIMVIQALSSCQQLQTILDTIMGTAMFILSSFLNRSSTLLLKHCWVYLSVWAGVWIIGEIIWISSNVCALEPILAAIFKVLVMFLVAYRIYSKCQVPTGLALDYCVVTDVKQHSTVHQLHTAISISFAVFHLLASRMNGGDSSIAGFFACIPMALASACLHSTGEHFERLDDATDGSSRTKAFALSANAWSKRVSILATFRVLLAMATLTVSVDVVNSLAPYMLVLGIVILGVVMYQVLG